MTVDSLIEDRRWDAVGLEAIAELATSAALTRLGLDSEHWVISLLACNDSRIAVLNADFRGRPQPTNVLSWPSDERGAAIAGEVPLPPDPTDPELGDIAIAYETCAKEAEDGGKSLVEHVTHLIIHGTLHLLGYDHQRDADAALMEGLETEILGAMGIADPYLDPDPERRNTAGEDGRQH